MNTIRSRVENTSNNRKQARHPAWIQEGMGTLRVEVHKFGMKKWIVMLLLLPLILFGNTPAAVYGEAYEMQEESEQSGTFEPFKRGSYRSPRQGYNPGIGTPARTTPTRPDNAARNPTTPRTTPAPRTGFGGFFGGLFGGLALGTILGSLFNPFSGFSLGFPVLSIISLILWVVVIFAVVRFFRKRRGQFH
jgi:hypothetical protein